MVEIEIHLPAREMQRRRNAVPRWTGTKRVRKIRGQAPRGLERLISLGLVVQGSPIALTIETILNRLESPRSVSASTSELADFLRFCSSRDSDPFVSARDLVSTYVADTRDRWAPLTRRRALSTIRVFYAEAFERGLYVGANPTNNIASITGGAKSDPKKALTGDETTRMLDFADHRVAEAAGPGDALRAKRDRLALNTFIYCGLRCAELVGLDWESLRSTGPYRILDVTGKGDKDAEVKVSPRLDRMFSDYRADLVAAGLEVRDSDPIFFGLVTLNSAWPPSVRRASGAIMPWSTRQASRMVDSGSPKDRPRWRSDIAAPAAPNVRNACLRPHPRPLHGPEASASCLAGNNGEALHPAAGSAGGHGDRPSGVPGSVGTPLLDVTSSASTHRSGALTERWGGRQRDVAVSPSTHYPGWTLATTGVG